MVKNIDDTFSALVDKWLVFVVLEFVSAALGFAYGFMTRNVLYVYVGGFFFSLGVFALTRWGYDKWRGKQKKTRKPK